MKTRWITLLAFLLVANGLLAQTYTFKVLASKGKTEIKSTNGWQDLKVGASLIASDEIKVSENAYLGLMHSNGKPLEIKEAKNYKVSELVARLGTGTSVLNKYTDFILSSNEQKKNRLTATGAVHRGVKDVIIIYLPASEKADLYGDKIGLQWAAEDITGPYEITFTNLLEDKLAKFETNENQLMVSLNEGLLKNELNIMVKVVSKAHPGQGSKDYVIKKLRPQDREKFAKPISEMSSSLEEGSALSKYIMAGFYEENFLLNDALTAYQEAIKLAPEVEAYKVAYAEFLKRLGFEVK
jgi:hypothetical protein